MNSMAGPEPNQRPTGSFSMGGEAVSGETRTTQTRTRTSTARGICFCGPAYKAESSSRRICKPTTARFRPRGGLTFGPGKGKYIEARVNLTGLQARGPWVAFWLFDPTDTYDGNPSNGTEIDIMEYIVDGGWMMNRFNVANHWGTSEGKIIDAGAYGTNLRTGWHTFGLEWTTGQLTYYMDGKQVWTTTRGVSTSKEQALLLSVEYDQGPGDAWEINKNVLNDAGKLPDAMLVDYVRVYEKR